MAKAQGFTFSIGVVGHRNLAAEHIDALDRALTTHFESLAELLGTSHSRDTVAGPIPIRLYTALAEGADRIFAQVALRTFGSRVSLVAVLPFEAKEYERDFPESVSEFRDLLAKCESVHIMSQTPAASRNERYRLAWQYICAQSNLLFALWDMKPGLDAGTAECLRTRCFSAPKTQLGEAYMAGPVIVLPTSRTRENAFSVEDALVNHLDRNGWIAACTSDTGALKNAMPAHAEWIRDYTAVALAIDSKRAESPKAVSALDAEFQAADVVATLNQKRVDGRLKILAVAFYILAIGLIFAGNLLPRAPVNLLAATLTVLAVIAWTRMRGQSAFRLYLYARALAEGMRIQRALNRMGITRRAVDLLRYRSGSVPTTLRELLRSIGSAEPGPPGQYEDCAGWLTEQINYYTGSAQLRQQTFERRERIRKNGFVFGGASVAVLLIAAQCAAWFFGFTIPGIVSSLAFATVVSLMTASFLMGVHTQQMQLRELGASFERMRSVLLTYRDWMKATEQSQNKMPEKEKADAAQWLLAQALAEHEDWCLRQSGAVV